MKIKDGSGDVEDDRNVISSPSPLSILSPLSLCTRLPKVISGSITWRVIPVCFLVSASTVGLQTDSAPLAIHSSLGSDRYTTFGGCVRDSALGRANSKLQTRTAEGSLYHGDYIVDVRQVAPAEIHAAKLVSGPPSILPNGASVVPDARHSCLGSSSFPNYALLYDSNTAATRSEPLAIPVCYERFRLTPEGGAEGGGVVRAVRDACIPEYRGMHEIAPSPRASSSSRPDLSYAEALEMPGFIGSCIMIVGLRFSPGVTAHSALWRPSLNPLGPRISASHTKIGGAGYFSSPMDRPSLLGRTGGSSSSGISPSFSGPASGGGVYSLAPPRSAAVITISDSSDDEGVPPPSSAVAAPLEAQIMPRTVSVPAIRPVAAAAPPAIEPLAINDVESEDPSTLGMLIPAKRRAEISIFSQQLGRGRIRADRSTSPHRGSDSVQIGCNFPEIAPAALPSGPHIGNAARSSRAIAAIPQGRVAAAAPAVSIADVAKAEIPLESPSALALGGLRPRSRPGNLAPSIKRASSIPVVHDPPQDERDDIEVMPHSSTLLPRHVELAVPPRVPRGEGIPSEIELPRHSDPTAAPSSSESTEIGTEATAMSRAVEAQLNECAVCTEEFGSALRWKLEPCGHTDVCERCLITLFKGQKRLARGRAPASIKFSFMECPMCRGVTSRASALSKS